VRDVFYNFLAVFLSLVSGQEYHLEIIVHEVFAWAVKKVVILALMDYFHVVVLFTPMLEIEDLV
tara:strand:+ start:174 stop:365 length:192 start_codon:yes stop_codon:yes gene_type:complete